jgi:para-aminobenzoate synthetase component I
MTDSKKKKEKQIITAITPLGVEYAFEDIFYTLATKTKINKYIAFLDSSLVPNRFSTYSYLAWEPEFVLKSSGVQNRIMDICTGTKEKVRGHPIKFLERILENNIFSSTENIYFDDLNMNTEICASQKTGFSNWQVSGKKSVINHKKNICQKNDFGTGDNILPDYKGGFIGYFSYDLKNYIEKLPEMAKKDLRVPVFYLCYYLKFLAFNHKNGMCYIIKNYKKPPDGFEGRAPDDRPYKTGSYFPGHGVDDGKSFTENIRKDLLQEKQKINQQLEHRLNCCNQKINDLIIKKYKAKKIENPELISNFSKVDYIRAILNAKGHIHNGDIYQANISQRFSCSVDVVPADLYYMLRQKNPAPFCAYLSFPGLKIGCSSPERFIFLKDKCVQTRPIKGTRPRGINITEDNRYIKELQESLKDHAELNMIVDLERNDLGRFCKYGTVKVNEHAVVEKYAKVFHLVSTITGQLQEGYSHTDIIKAAFPGGSITGAPKIRAMEIIDSLEPAARNIYTGSIGYIGLDGTMDLNIAIRTFVIKNKKFYYNVGGGIVEDSIPESEYMETMDKGLALKETLEFFSKKNMDKLRDN